MKGREDARWVVSPKYLRLLEISLTVGFGNEVIWFCCGWLVGWLRYERRVKRENKENKKERRGRGRIERCGVYILALFSRFHSLSVLLFSFPSSNLHALIFLPFPCSLRFTTSLPPPIPPLITTTEVRLPSLVRSLSNPQSNNSPKIKPKLLTTPPSSPPLSLDFLTC